MSIRLAKLVRDFYKRSGASQQARLFDLKYVGFGRYATKEGHIVALSENGKLKWLKNENGQLDLPLSTPTSAVQTQSANANKMTDDPYSEPVTLSHRGDHPVDDATGEYRSGQGNYSGAPKNDMKDDTEIKEEEKRPERIASKVDAKKGYDKGARVKKIDRSNSQNWPSDKKEDK